MNLAIQTTTSRTWREMKAHYLLVGGVALAIAAVAASGGWQLSRSGGPSASSVSPRSVIAANAAQSEPGMTYYLVSSQAQADSVLGGLEEAVRIQVAAGDSPRLSGVYVVVATEAAVAQTHLAVDHGNQIRGPLGLSEIKLVEMRAPVH